MKRDPFFVQTEPGVLRRRQFSIRALLIAVTCFAFVFAWLGWMASSPLRRSDADLREWLLDKAPVGTHKAQVRELFAQHGWREVDFHATRPLPATEPFVGAELGDYLSVEWFPFPATVYGFWEFDDNDELVNIRFQRFIDSP